MNINNKTKYFIAGFFLIALIGLPVILSFTQKKQELRSRASASTSLYFTPSASASSPLVANVGDTFSFDIMLNPGTNLPSVLKLDIQYDPTKLQAGPTSFLANSEAFPVTLEGPVASDGSIKISLSIGSDSTKAIQTITKVGKITLFALNPTGGTPTPITFGTNTLALSVGSTDYANENVLSTTDSAYVLIQNPVTDTPTPAPTGQTSFNISTYLHGIGSSGDNSNPTDSRLSNKAPQHLQRNASVYIYNAQNQLISTSSGIINYASESGNFLGKIDVNSIIPQGVYTVKIKSSNHLMRLVAGIQAINPDQINTLPAVTLTAGDIVEDNMLNILDYNLLINCYSDLQPAKACTDTEKVSSDINDDNAVNQVDYNLFLREISVQSGY